MKRYYMLIRPKSPGAPYVTVPGTYAKHEAEEAKAEIIAQNTLVPVEVLIIPVGY